MKMKEERKPHHGPNKGKNKMKDMTVGKKVVVQKEINKNIINYTNTHFLSGAAAHRRP
jgi:hypothetical protein